MTPLREKWPRKASSVSMARPDSTILHTLALGRKELSTHHGLEHGNPETRVSVQRPRFYLKTGVLSKSLWPSPEI